MKILLDECLPLDFRHSFPGHDAHTAQWAGLKGKKNGELLRAAEVAGYDVLLTVDQGIPHQQSSTGRKLSIILVRSRSNQIEDHCRWWMRSYRRWRRSSGQMVTIPLPD
jgi:predicted nuclease of predicted toxin-antitoxin system